MVRDSLVEQLKELIKSFNEINFRIDNNEEITISDIRKFIERSSMMSITMIALIDDDHCFIGKYETKALSRQLSNFNCAMISLIEYVNTHKNNLDITYINDSKKLLMNILEHIKDILGE